MTTRRIVVLLGFALTIAALAFATQRFLAFQALAAHESRLRQSIEAFPVAAWLVGLAIYVLVSLVPGTGGKAMVFGWLFGFLPGLLLVNLGLTVAALVAFLVVRFVFQSAVHRRLGAISRRIDEALLREGGVYLLTLRLLHMPYSLTNYAAGATTVPTRTFWWTTQLGMLPGNVVFVLAGSQLPTLTQLVERGPLSLINFPLLLSLSLAGLLPVAIRTAVRKWRNGVPAG